MTGVVRCILTIRLILTSSMCIQCDSVLITKALCVFHNSYLTKMSSFHQRPPISNQVLFFIPSLLSYTVPVMFGKRRLHKSSRFLIQEFKKKMEHAPPPSTNSLEVLQHDRQTPNNKGLMTVWDSPYHVELWNKTVSCRNWQAILYRTRKRVSALNLPE